MRTSFLLALGAALGAFALPAPAAAQPQLAAAVQGVAVTPAFLIGRWTDDGDCANTVEFLGDGQFATSEGARGRWWLSNGRITFQGSQTLSARIHATSPTHIVLTHDDGTIGESSRCTAAPQQRAMPPLPATPQALAMSRPASRQMLIGRWTDTGDCSNIVTFFTDGRFTVPSGAGTWTLVGERLTFRGSSTVSARARAVGENRIFLIHDDGTIGQSIRC